MQFNYIAPVEVKRAAEVKNIALTDTTISQIRTMSPQEVDAWVDTNVNTIDDVKLVLKKLIISLIATYNKG